MVSRRGREEEGRRGGEGIDEWTKREGDAEAVCVLREEGARGKIGERKCVCVCVCR